MMVWRNNDLTSWHLYVSAFMYPRFTYGFIRFSLREPFNFNFRWSLRWQYWLQQRNCYFLHYFHNLCGIFNWRIPKSLEALLYAQIEFFKVTIIIIDKMRFSIFVEIGDSFRVVGVIWSQEKFNSASFSYRWFIVCVTSSSLSSDRSGSLQAFLTYSLNNCSPGTIVVIMFEWAYLLSHTSR